MAKSSKQPTKPVESFNPFFVALRGITSLFSNALSVGIVVLVISAVVTIVSTFWPDENATSEESIQRTIDQLTSLQGSEIILAAAIAIIVVIFGIVAGAMLHGIQSYTAAQLARGNKVTIGQAFSVVLGKLGNYIILYVWMNIKIFLWTLLLIVPGVIAYYRYSFAGLVFFDKDLRHEHAIKESNRLAKGGVMTLFSSQTLFSIITFGYIDRIVSLASISELYREYAALDTRKKDKPSIHWLSWLTLAIPFIVLFMVMLFIIALVVAIGAAGGMLK